MMRRLLSLLALTLPLAALAVEPQAGAGTPAPASVRAQGEASAPAPAANAAAPDVAAPNPAPASGPAAVPAPVQNTAPVAMPSGSPTGSLLQTLLALIVVLGVLGALAWFLKRYGPRAGGASANVKVVGSLSLGGRERLLVVEVGNQWIVVGASPGRVNGLATMPKQEGVDATATLVTPGPSANSFADWLRQTIEKRK